MAGGDGEFGGYRPPCDAVLALDAAMAEVLRIDRAEARAQSRAEALRAAVRACRAEMHGSDDPELIDALDALLEDLDRMEAALPLETAFRADERDRALSGTGDTVCGGPGRGGFVAISGLVNHPLPSQPGASREFP